MKRFRKTTSRKSTLAVAGLAGLLIAGYGIFQPATPKAAGNQFTFAACPVSPTGGYPNGSAPALSSVPFNESEVLFKFAAVNNKITAWYNDEHELTLGIRRVVVKTSSGSQTFDS